MIHAKAETKGIAPYPFQEAWKHKLRYPGAQYIEILPDWRERLPGRVGAAGRILQSALQGKRSVLDVGAYDRYYERVLRALGVCAIYKSCDVDNADCRHDYTDFLTVPDSFDAILLLELLEHLDLTEGIRFIEHAACLLNPGGLLVVSTPNAAHPNQVWRSEVSHVRPWPAADLFAHLKCAGFDKVEIYRQYLASRRRRRVRQIVKLLYRLMELDHAQSLMAFAWKPW